MAITWKLKYKDETILIASAVELVRQKRNEMIEKGSSIYDFKIIKEDK